MYCFQVKLTASGAGKDFFCTVGNLHCKHHVKDDEYTLAGFFFFFSIALWCCHNLKDKFRQKQRQGAELPNYFCFKHILSGRKYVTTESGSWLVQLIV